MPGEAINRGKLDNPPADIASAARRVAEDIRQGNRPLPDDMLAILPVLDAVAAGRDDAERVERWARAIAVAVGKLENRWEWFVAEARAAIALADAERAAAEQTEFAKACADIDRRADDISASVAKRRSEFREAARGPTKPFKL